MAFVTIICVYSENHSHHVNTVCEGHERSTACWTSWYIY